mmetsp:Transcript_52573/g.128960  ORF Transcript_52573/g.128960 Transcript_52573/m.128960 type:complete len:120 (+) Transcript_52573:79-438(+)
MSLVDDVVSTVQNGADRAQGVPPQQQQQQGTPGGATVVQQAPVFGRTPVQTTCPSCQQSVQTTCVLKPGIACHLGAMAICWLFGLWCGCCLLPYMIDDAKDVHHMCPNCNAFIAVKKVL